MYFENQSESAELDWLREGLADMLITNLSRSKNLTVLNRQRLHSLLERSKYGPEDKISLDLAMGIARKSRAEVVVLGNFARFGEKLRINIHLYDAQTGQALQSESLNIDRLEQIPMQVDLLSIKIASYLGAHPAEQERAEGSSGIMTNNLEAFRYYSLALEKAQGFHSAEALALLKRAVALDPQFAMAYARIGYIHAMIRNGEGEQAKPFLEKAFQLSHRLNEKDKLYVTAWYAQANIDHNSAIRAFRQITQQYPLETEAYWRLGFQLQQAGRFEEAADAYRQGLAIDPEAKDIYNKLGFIYSNLGRYDEAIAAHRRYVELAPDEPNAYDSLGITLTEAGHYEAAFKELARALELNPKFHFASLHTADIYFRLGRYRAAQAEYERFLDLAPSAWDRGVGYNRLVLLRLRRGQLSEAAAARQEFKHQKDLGGPMLVALARNDFSAAARWKTRLFESPTYAWPNTSYGAQLRAYLLGTYELKRGHTREAIELLREASYRPPLLWTVGSVIDSLANAYLELGRFDEAIAEYERLLSLNPNYPPARYHLAQAYERKGEREKALAEYYRFLQIWKDADPNLPELVSARKISSASPQLSAASRD
jgi:tetratricopeptide (TPR) repeat protein